MSKIHVYTQDYENYAFDEDGTPCTGTGAYWKAKGSTDYFIPVPEDFNLARAGELVELCIDRIEINNDFCSSSIAGWAVVPDDFRTTFELDQQEFDGKILWPTQVIDIAEVLAL